MEWLQTTDVIIAALAVLLNIPSAVVAIRQYRGRLQEKKRADRAEKARDRIGEELAAARRELAGSRQAHERLASIERGAASEAKRSTRREESQRRSQDRKILREQRKQTKASELVAKETKRQGRRRK
jgi:hypothetical protein